MAVRPEFRWWILTLVLVALLVGISLLAMDRSNVVWRDGDPSCPHCRSDVESFSSRCPTCREQYDWAVAATEESPLSPFSLSALEAKALVDRILELGDEVAGTRVAQALGVTREAAHAYLKAVGRGRCGYCGGTGLTLATEPKRKSAPCPVCLGQGACVACNGDRRMRMGDEGASVALRRYALALADLDPRLPEATRREEVKVLGDEFLRRYSGTVEATQILFWPTVDLDGRFDGLLAAASSPALVLEAARQSTYRATSVLAARDRLDAVLGAVAAE